MNVYSKKIMMAMLCFVFVFAAPVFLHAELQAQEAGAPTISGVNTEVTEIEYNSKVNVRSGITASAADGNSLTNRIVIKVKAPGETSYGTTIDKVLTLKSTGSYKVMYEVTDPARSQSTTVYRTIKSVDTKAPVIQSKNNFSELVLSYNTKKVSYKSLMKGITAFLVSGKNMRPKVSIKIQDPAGNSSTVMKNGTYKLTEYGNYTITYLCANANKSLKTGLYLSTRETRSMVLSSPISYALAVPKDKVSTAKDKAIDLMKNVYVKVIDKSKKKPERVTKRTEGISCTVLWKKNKASKGKKQTVSDLNKFVPGKYGIFEITYEYVPEDAEALTAVRTVLISKPEKEKTEEEAEEEKTEEEETVEEETVEAEEAE